MRAVILGCGKLGSRLAQKLSEAGHQIVIMDRDQEALKKLGPNFKGETLAGTAYIEENIQRIFEEKTDVFIAVADKDNVNIMLAQWVKNKFKVPRAIVRIYDPILAGLEFFYGRVVPGGFILVHDFNSWPGARRAVREFFRNKPEVPVPLPDKSGSALITKLGARRG